jgi:hypothetical protein
MSPKSLSRGLGTLRFKQAAWRLEGWRPLDGGRPPQFLDALFRDTFRSGWKFTLQLFAGGLMFVNIFHPTWNETLRQLNMASWKVPHL